jgi:hypothetical protein
MQAGDVPTEEKRPMTTKRTPPPSLSYPVPSWQLYWHDDTMAFDERRRENLAWFEALDDDVELDAATVAELAWLEPSIVPLGMEYRAKDALRDGRLFESATTAGLYTRSEVELLMRNAERILEPLPPQCCAAADDGAFYDREHDRVGCKRHHVNAAKTD